MSNRITQQVGQVCQRAESSLAVLTSAAPRRLVVQRWNIEQARPAVRSFDLEGGDYVIGELCLRFGGPVELEGPEIADRFAHLTHKIGSPGCGYARYTRIAALDEPGID